MARILPVPVALGVATLLSATAVAGVPKPTSSSSTQPSSTRGTAAKSKAQSQRPMVDRGKIPAKNHAYWLGAGGAIDTDIAFADFIGGDFTVTMWAQPEFQFGGAGPIVGEKGSGVFHIGQGDYRDGPYDRDLQEPEHAMMRVEIGSRSAVYEVPEVDKNAWVHLAVVRKGKRVRLYVNGVERAPYRDNDTVPSLLILEKGDYKMPKGTVRIGRRTSTDGGQFYGFVDDVGFFKTALTPSQVALVAAQKRLSGKESHLWRGIGFDAAPSSTLPMKLHTALTPNTMARQYEVSKTRRRSDRAVWGNPLHLAAAYPIALQLPFAKNEVWRVVQGMNDPGPSHNGQTAFASIDFKPTKGCTGGKAYATTSGNVIAYRDNDNPTKDREANYLQLVHSSSLGFTYMHFEYKGLVGAIKGGSTHPKDPEGFTLLPGGIPFAVGDELGIVGDDGCHLHIGAWKSPDGERIPYPYADFEVSTDNGKTWAPVVRGIPRKGMLVRRMKDVPQRAKAAPRARSGGGGIGRR